MKRIYNIHAILLITVFTGLVSCDGDFLDRNPLDAYSNSSLWSTASDASSALNGCYNAWDDAYYTMYMDCASDNAYSQFYWEGYTYYGNGTVTPSSDYAENRWDYGVVQKCNWFLANIDETPMDEGLKGRFKAEARFLRAYQYFVMSQLYGDVPLVTQALDIEEANSIGRTPVGEVQDFILSELQEIAPLLPESYSGEDTGRITRGAAYALKARLELYTGDYAACVEDCEKVMALGYGLYPSYPDLFRIQNENNTEVILDIQYMENNYSNGNIGIFPSSSYGGWASINPTQDMVDAYEMSNGKTIDDVASGYSEDAPYDNRDPRLSYSVIYPGQWYGGKYYNPIESTSADYYNGGNNSKTGYLVKKYIADLSDYTDMWNTGLNIIVIRYAEILLSYAEAKIELGQIDQSVYDAINEVRGRESVNMPAVSVQDYPDKTSLRELVRHERRIELAFEGLRWYDIKRWKIGDQVMSGPIHGTRLGTVNADTGELHLTGGHIHVEDRIFDSGKNYLWPVPQKEMDINTNLTQNPLY